MIQSNNPENIFRHILKSSTSMYENPVLEYFRTTTGIQWRPIAFEESGSFISFLTKLVLTGILCSFRLILKWKVDKEILLLSRLEFSEKI